MTAPALDALLALQERDLTLDRLRHRRDTLADRETVARGLADAAALAARVSELAARRDEIARDEARLDDEASALQSKAVDAEAMLYSGAITSPRELQDLQADVEQLRRHQRDVENRELELMEAREPLDTELAELDDRRRAIAAELEAARASLAVAEDEIDVEVAVERAARDAIAAGVSAALVAEYERCREQAQGPGAARLVGVTCQGCHLTIPATEAERIKKAPEGEIAHCDNCGCILVP